MSKLFQIQATAQQVAEAIASVLDVDVTIVDDTLTRVAGTGSYEKKIGTIVPVGSAFGKVLKHGQDFIIENPREHVACDTCVSKVSCCELAEVCCPIRTEKQIIGVIGLIAFNERQKNSLLNNQQNLLRFLNRMSELIASKVAQEEALNQISVAVNQLEAVLNSVHEGIIATDAWGKITHLNASAARLFQVSAEDVIGKPINHVVPNSPMLDVLSSGKGYTDLEMVSKVKQKKFHYLSTAKPIMVDEKLAGAVATFRDISEVRRFVYRMSEPQLPYTFEQIKGVSAALKDVIEKAKKAAASSSTVLIRGESGTGKELFARAIHNESTRSQRLCVAINCAAIPETLLESELFGYEEGAFTGAKRGGKPGKFEIADKGTLFLDEIGDMSLSLQAKLLRVLEDKRIERIGATEPIPINVRVIAATNKDLEAMVGRGEFREDLYYRLNVIPLFIPPLRERKADIPILLDYFLKKFNHLLNKDIERFTPEAHELLLAYDWPGNVRELENVVEYAVNMETTRYITLNSLPLKIKESKLKLAPAVDGQVPKLKDLERQAIVMALNKFGNTTHGKEEAAEALGISRATLYRKIKEYKLE